MERLTKRGTRKNGYVSAIGSGFGCWGKIIDRLADYEDTGLGPEEVTDLQRAWNMYGGEEGITALLSHSPNAPLTLEELHEMDGEPVWVRVSKNWKDSGVSEGWRLVKFHTTDDRIRVYTYDTRHGASFLAQQDCGISWWAYRRKPKEGAT